MKNQKWFFLFRKKPDVNKTGDSIRIFGRDIPINVFVTAIAYNRIHLSKMKDTIRFQITSKIVSTNFKLLLSQKLFYKCVIMFSVAQQRKPFFYNHLKMFWRRELDYQMKFAHCIFSLVITIKNVVFIKPIF